MNIGDIKANLFASCAIVDDKMYFFPIFDRTFLKMDLQTQEAVYIDSYDEQSEEVLKHVSTKMIVADGNIYSLDTPGKYMIIYNLLKDQYQTVDISCDDKPWGNFSALYFYDNKIFIFLRCRNEIVIVDADTFELERQQIEIDSDDIEFLSCKIGQEVFSFLNNSQNVFIYNLQTKCCRKYLLPQKIINCRHVIEYNKLFYLLGKDGEVVTWNKDTDAMSLLIEGDIGASFGRIVVTDKKIWLLPSLDEKIVIYDRNEQTKSVFDNYPSDFQYCGPSNSVKYYEFAEYDAHYYFPMRSCNYLLRIDAIEGTGKWIGIKFPEEMVRMEHYFRTLKKQAESYLSLHSYIQAVKNMDMKIKDTETIKDKMAKKIIVESIE